MLAKSALAVASGKNLNLGKLFVGVCNSQIVSSSVRHASAFKFVPETAPAELGETTKMNLCQAVTNALDITLSSDKSSGTRPLLFFPIFISLYILAFLLISLFCLKFFFHLKL